MINEELAAVSHQDVFRPFTAVLFLPEANRALHDSLLDRWQLSQHVPGARCPAVALGDWLGGQETSASSSEAVPLGTLVEVSVAFFLAALFAVGSRSVRFRESFVLGAFLGQCCPRNSTGVRYRLIDEVSKQASKYIGE